MELFAGRWDDFISFFLGGGDWEVEVSGQGKGKKRGEKEDKEKGKGGEQSKRMIRGEAKRKGRLGTGVERLGKKRGRVASGQARWKGR